MASFHTGLEKQRLEQLARDYQGQGYAVVILPTDDCLPELLKGFVVGILAIRGDQLLLAAARLCEHLTLDGAADLTAITGQIAQMPNASWELVVVDPKREGGRDESPSR